MKTLLIVMAWLTGNCLSYSQSFNLQTYRWQKRVLLLFAPDDKDKYYQEQMAQVGNKQSGYTERDLIIISIFVESGKTTDQQKPKLSVSEVQQLRADFDVRQQEFGVILIGKDGGEKLRKKEVVSSATLFDIIDAMPMRRSEKQHRQK